MSQPNQHRAEGLGDLLSHDFRAKEFFLTLPEDGQGVLQQHSDHIRSIEDMRRFTSGLPAKPQSNQNRFS